MELLKKKLKMKSTFNFSVHKGSISKMLSYNLQSDLFEACKKSDPKAQLQFYKFYHKPLYGISLTILNDPIEAEKIIQESFLVAFEKIGFFPKEVSFITWLNTLVKNRSTDSIRDKLKLSTTDAKSCPEKEYGRIENLSQHEEQDRKINKVSEFYKCLIKSFRNVITHYYSYDQSTYKIYT